MLDILLEDFFSNQARSKSLIFFLSGYEIGFKPKSVFNEMNQLISQGPCSAGKHFKLLCLKKTNATDHASMTKSKGIHSALDFLSNALINNLEA